MNGPDYVYSLSSGVQPTGDPVSLHPLEIEDIDQQVREIELHRARAAVSCRDYLIT